jgi:hypothetical protein
MDLKQEFREEKNMDVYAMNVNDGSFSNVYVKWLEAKINYTRCCESDSEQFSFADMRDAFDYASVSSQRRDGYTFKEWISKR